MNTELIVVKGKVIEQERGYSPNAGKDIGYEKAARMIKRSCDANPDDVIAHFIGKNAIEKILSQPGCVGLRSFYALNEVGIKQIVFVGVDDKGRNLLGYKKIENTGNESKVAGAIYSAERACPPYCEESTGLESDTELNWWPF